MIAHLLAQYFTGVLIHCLTRLGCTLFEARYCAGYEGIVIPGHNVSVYRLCPGHTDQCWSTEKRVQLIDLRRVQSYRAAFPRKGTKRNDHIAAQRARPLILMTGLARCWMIE